MSSHQKTFYYFKRWLWLIFPNACLESSRDCDFSEFMQSCFGKNDKTILEKKNKELEECASTIVAEILILQEKTRAKNTSLEVQFNFRGSYRSKSNPSSILQRRRRSRLSFSQLSRMNSRSISISTNHLDRSYNP